MKIEPRLKAPVPGRTIKSTPMKPTSSAAHRRGPTVSPSTSTDSRVIMSGPELRMAETSASGRATSPIMKVV